MIVNFDSSVLVAYYTPEEQTADGCGNTASVAGDTSPEKGRHDACHW